jgi:hypothetical protein
MHRLVASALALLVFAAPARVANCDHLTLKVDEGVFAELVALTKKIVQNAANQSATRHNLRSLERGMNDYSSEQFLKSGHAVLPPVANFEEQNKPLLSWRVHLLPYLGEKKLYKEFHLNEPWDSDHNKKLIARMPKVYANPYNPKLAADGKMTILAPVHKDALFTGEPKNARFPNPLPTCTILLVDVTDDAVVIWTKPDDLKLDPKAPHKGLSARHGDKYTFLYADSSVHVVPKTIDNKSLWALFLWDSEDKPNLP